ncbi:transcriptional regulator [Bosea sp. (in: a-proteobacteria)]|uniref:transcriptional regulator n=1 Tax=Bosea sp. (in: a-proteobacteria) TaxID=1871050 RepID=UPI003B3AAA34
MSKDTIADAVKIVGSQAKLAAAIGRSQQHISFLANGQYEPSAEDSVAIERATGGQVPRWRLRPDLWPHPLPRRESEGAAA